MGHFQYLFNEIKHSAAARTFWLCFGLRITASVLLFVRWEDTILDSLALCVSIWKLCLKKAKWHFMIIHSSRINCKECTLCLFMCVMDCHVFQLFHGCFCHWWAEAHLLFYLKNLNNSRGPLLASSNKNEKSYLSSTQHTACIHLTGPQHHSTSVHLAHT